MKSEFSEQQRARISQELERTRREIEHLERMAAEQGQRNAESELGPADDLRADVSEGIDERTTARNELSEQLRHYQRALDRIDQGVYQVCERCGREIAPERLEAQPTATLCIDCQREIDREQGSL